MIYSTISRYSKRISFWVVGASAALLSAGCSSDNPFGDIASDDSAVRFTIAMRSDADDSGMPPSHRAVAGSIVLKGTDTADSLSLSVTVTDGIDASVPGGGVLSRGSAVSTGKFYKSIGILAYLGRDPWDDAVSSPGFMYDEEVTAVSNWTTGHNWPGSRFHLRFFAYAPYQAEGSSLSAMSEVGPPVLSYTVPDNVTRQSDLLTAQTADMTGNSVSAQLTFDHQLTAVRFIAEDIRNGGIIQSVRLRQVYSSGSLEWGGEWTGLSAIKDFSYDKEFETEGSYGMVINADADTATFMMMPQHLPKDAAIEVMYKDREGNNHTLSASIAGTEWPKGKTVTYRISYSNISIEPPLRNIPQGEIFISSDNHNLSLDFSNSTFDEMEVRVYKRLVTTDLGDNAAAYAATAGVLQLTGAGYGPADYGALIVEPKMLRSGVDTRIDNIELVENADENMLWQIVVQYRLPDRDGSYDGAVWEDAGTIIYQDARPCDGQDWIFYYDSSKAWKTPIHNQVIYKSSRLMRTMPEGPVALDELSGQVWYQCDHAAGLTFQQDIAKISEAFASTQLSGATNCCVTVTEGGQDKPVKLDRIADVHYVTGTYECYAVLNYVCGEVDALKPYDTQITDMNHQTGDVPQFNMAVNMTAVGEITTPYPLDQDLPELVFDITAVAHKVYDPYADGGYLTTAEVSDQHLVVLPHASVPAIEEAEEKALLSGTGLEWPYKDFGVDYNPCKSVSITIQSPSAATPKEIVEGRIYRVDDARLVRNVTKGFDNVTPLFSIQREHAMCMSWWGSEVIWLDIQDVRTGLGHWDGNYATTRVSKAGFALPFNATEERENSVGYSLKVDDPDTNIWVRKPYTAVAAGSDVFAQQ